MRLIAVFLLLLVPVGATDLIPKPRKMTPQTGQLLVDVQTAVIAAESLHGHAEVIATAIQKTTGFLHRIRTPQQVGQMVFKRAIRLALAGSSEKPGFYRLEITPDGATITAADRNGLMHGAQTFANLLPVAREPRQRVFIPAQVIEDWPETSRRIFHLDVGAHLFPVDQLKSLIDWLSFHKLNELHLQFNNDHGWRMESQKFPQLHLVGGVRASTPPYGDRSGSDSTEYRGHYTREDISDLIAHADSRAITIVPSFAITGGASAIIASYPDLGKEAVEVAKTWEPRQIGLPKNEKTLTFLNDLFAEVATLFPASEIRIEGPRTELHPELELLLAKHQRSLLIPGVFATTDLSLYPRPEEAELLLNPKLEAEGGFNPVPQVYQLIPSPAGAQATLRTEFVHDFEKLQYLAFPRLAAFAEATWLPPSLQDYPGFQTRLKAFDSRYRLAGVEASFAYDPPVAKTKYGTSIESSLEHRDGHSPGLIFDGRGDTFFWSKGKLEADDHLTLAFPWPLSGGISVSTGLPGSSGTILEEGVLELSENGKVWHTSEPFIAGSATATVTDPTRFVRVRAIAPQATPLVLTEVLLSEELLVPLHEESREILLPVTREKTTLTFKADFRNHPDLRQEIEQARQTFFAEWLPLAQKIGVSHLPGTSRVFELKPGEPGEMNPKQVDGWMIKKMIPWLQDYPVSSPLWFTSGFTALLLGELPAKTDRSQFKNGGPQSAAFLAWIASKYGDRLLPAISLDCHRGQYRPAIWKTLTGQSLEDLRRDYQDNGG